MANGFAIGSLPEKKCGNISNILSIMIDPTQPFMYGMALKCGSNKNYKEFLSDSFMLKKIRTGVLFSLSNPSKK